MELFDYLTDEDKICLKEFIESCVGIEDVDIKKSLRYWNRDKLKMFKALGRKLRVKIPIDVDSDYKLFINKLYETYQPPFGYSAEGQTNHLFIDDFETFWSKRIANSSLDQRVRSKGEMTELFKYDNIKNGYLNRTYEWCNKLDGFNLKLPMGAKTMKSIQKMLKTVEYPRMDLFEQWRNAISNLTTSKHIKTNLVFSIHPIDFLTMSDNNCGWRSCMSWLGEGQYSSGVVEMMNSNMVIIAYLESSKPFAYNGHPIPNKTWRTLMYVHKNILLAGKSYPFLSTDVTTLALDKLRELVYNNLGWKYQYVNQQYSDMKPYHSEIYVRRKRDFTEYQHKIIVYMNGMYNDLIKDGEYSYLCCRNYVPKTLRLCASGVNNCMCCGQPIMSQKSIDEAIDLEDLDPIRYGDKLCCNCRKAICECCYRVTGEEMVKIQCYAPNNRYDKSTTKLVCKKCLYKEYYYDPIRMMYIHSNDLIAYKEDYPDYKLRRVAA